MILGFRDEPRLQAASPEWGVQKTTETLGSDSLVVRPKTRRIPESLVCRILLFIYHVLHNVFHIEYNLYQILYTIYHILCTVHHVCHVCHVLYTV